MSGAVHSAFVGSAFSSRVVISGVPKLSVTLVCESKLYRDGGLVEVLDDPKLLRSWAKLLVEL